MRKLRSGEESLILAALCGALLAVAGCSGQGFSLPDIFGGGFTKSDADLIAFGICGKAGPKDAAKSAAVQNALSAAKAALATGDFGGFAAMLGALETIDPVDAELINRAINRVMERVNAEGITEDERVQYLIAAIDGCIDGLELRATK